VATITSRKDDHLALCRTGDVGFRNETTLFECVKFLHEALPELGTADLDLRTAWLGKTLKAPILIAAMTGGSEDARVVNHTLAKIAERRGYAFGLGSQRAMLKAPQAASTYAVRSVAPTMCLLGNLGVVQARDMSAAQVTDVVRSIGADALCIHLNPAMELVQPGGDADFKGCADTLQRLASECAFPIIAKETGSGLSRRTGERLRALGICHVDVSGAGGTSWVGVEAKRAERAGDLGRTALGELFWDWGIPTAASVMQVSSLGFDSVVATGGIKTGLDIAKAIALGANIAGIARPVLQALHEGGEAGAEAFLQGVEDALRAAMILTGSRTPVALKAAGKILLGELSAYAVQKT
jgi:isopentenyl-diphosphate Delta-isomerase